MTETGSASAALVSLTYRERVAVLTLARPKVNALSLALLDELVAHLEALHRELPGALVVSGGDRVFAAGAEIHELRDDHSAHALVERLACATDLLERLPRVTIAAVRGFALGGGLELALSCDLRLVSSDARLGLPEIALGVFPGGGGTQRLARLIGAGRAKELIFTGRQVRADEALAIGLAQRVEEPDALFEAAVTLAASFASGPLVALGLAKRAIDEGLDLPLAEALGFERALFGEVLQSGDARRGIESFLEHGAGHARFEGN
jgi:enoyl-CoA hydratase